MARAEYTPPGQSAAEYYDGNETIPSDEDPTTPTTAMGRHRMTSSHGRTYSQDQTHSRTHSGSQSNGRSSRKTRKHSNTRDLIRMLMNAEDRDSKEALAILRRTSERLELETQRANEAERRVIEANERWRLINQSRLQAQAEAARLNEELKLYKLQLEAAQTQINRANDIIQLTDKEKILAEEEAAKAKRLAKRYEMETLIQKARDEGRRLGRQQGLREGIDQGYTEAWTDANARLNDELRRRGYDIEYGENDEEGTFVHPEDEFERETAGPSTPGPDMMRRQPRLSPIDIARTRSDPAAVSNSRRQNSFFRRRQDDPQRDRNVEVNEGAPDVATIVNGEPHATVVTPVLPNNVGQVNGGTSESGFRMPEPDFNPDPSSVHPIALMNAPRSPVHPVIDYPPDNYIPRQDSDGRVRLPPPHEFGPPPTTPKQDHSPLPNATSLPEVVPRETLAREMVHPRDEPNRRRGHHYQESVGSTATSNLSIISPPTQQRGASKAPQLYAIPEASPGSSIRQTGTSQIPGTPGPRFGLATPGSRSHGLPGVPVSEGQSITSNGPVRAAESVSQEHSFQH